MQATSEGLQKERDFYFQKLRQVEVVAQEAIEAARAAAGAGDAQLDEAQVPIAARHVLDILYATEVCLCLASYILVPDAGTPLEDLVVQYSSSKPQSLPA